mmetsp:Transcript_3366/g.5918  ORF Transcript_3366/g.5918 Transcript_3366/m.5918 type:complete len:88 (+) Transcript_3366:1238-1501(+)
MRKTEILFTNGSEKFFGKLEPILCINQFCGKTIKVINVMKNGERKDAVYVWGIIVNNMSPTNEKLRTAHISHVNCEMELGYGVQNVS